MGAGEMLGGVLHSSNALHFRQGLVFSVHIFMCFFVGLQHRSPMQNIDLKYWLHIDRNHHGSVLVMLWAALVEGCVLHVLLFLMWSVLWPPLSSLQPILYLINNFVPPLSCPAWVCLCSFENVTFPAFSFFCHSGYFSGHLLSKNTVDAQYDKQFGRCLLKNKIGCPC